MTANLLAAGVLLIAGGLGVRSLLRTTRALREVREQVHESAQEMARIHVDLARQLFVAGFLDEAVRHEKLATEFEDLTGRTAP